MKVLNIKAGSICIYKQHGWWKIFCAKLKRKELPYNKCLIYRNDSIMFVETTDTKLNDNDNYIILEPIKPLCDKYYKFGETLTIPAKVLYDSKRKNN